MKHKKALYLKLEIDGYQEDQIVGQSIKVAYQDAKTRGDQFDWPEEREALLKAFKLVYHYYTGKTL